MQHRWPVLALLLAILPRVVGGLLGCQHAQTRPPVPPPPEDLSTWAVPELVQPPPAPTPEPAPVPEKGSSAEQVYTFTPGTIYALTVPIGWPLDVILERGEQVRNLVGGDRKPQAEGQTIPWEAKEGTEGQGESLRSHVFVTASTPGLTLGLIV